MIQNILESASKILEQKYHRPVSLNLLDIVYGYEGSPSTLLRGAVNHTLENTALPKTLVIKQVNVNNDGLHFDLIGLEFLGQLTSHIPPKIYGYDLDAKIIILEDLGNAEEFLLGNILFGDDSVLAENALVEFNRTLAKVHLTTQGKQLLWQELSTKHGNPSQVSRHRINHIVETLLALPKRFQDIGVTMSDTAQENLNEARYCIENPEQFLAFVHGDSTPANAFYTQDTIRLFDLETSRFRHCLLDGSYSRIRYLHSVWARAIPLDIQQKSMDAYRKEFLAGKSINASDFDYHFVACCAAWLAGLFALLPTTIEKDKRWGRSTNRQRIITALEHFILIADELEHFQALRDMCIEVEQKLRQQWSEEDCTMQVYPAFNDSSS